MGWKIGFTGRPRRSGETLESPQFNPRCAPLFGLRNVGYASCLGLRGMQLNPLDPPSVLKAGAAGSSCAVSTQHMR
jgi:hypothetical protein